MTEITEFPERDKAHPEDSTPSIWRPVPSGATHYALVAWGVLSVCLLLGMGVVLNGSLGAVSTAVGGLSILGCLAVGTWALASALGYRSLQYRLDDECLTIVTGWTRFTIPLASIDNIYRGSRLEARVAVDGLNWPGYHCGTARTLALGPMEFFGTSLDPANVLIVHAAGNSYALTPADLEGFRGSLIERLESADGDLHALPQREAVPGLAWSLLDLLDRGIPWIAAGGIAIMLASSLLLLPAEVPDTNSPFGGNANGMANDWESTGQTFVPRWDGLKRVSLIIATDWPARGLEVTFKVKESPDGPALRSVKRPLSSVPRGNPFDYRPGSLTEQWYSFDFEPIPDSAGRKLYFSVEGKDIPRENSVKVYMNYHNEYRLGEAYRNERAEDAHVVFRAQAEGRVIDVLRVIGENLTRGKPGPLSNPLTYAGLAAIYLVLSGLLLITVGRSLRR